MLDAKAQERIAKTHAYLAEQNVDKAIKAAKYAHSILDEVIGFLKPGVLESEVKQFALDLFASHHMERTWHTPYIRFAEHTLLTFTDKAKEDFRLKEEDVAFVDLGILLDNIEGDAGRTVVLGDNKEFSRVAAASTIMFQDAVAYWARKNPTGVELYEYIYALAEKMNVDWNLDPAGHLIGAFPHRGWNRGINHFPEKVESGKWILEIQVKHKELPFGAFFEDLLYSER